MDSKVKKALSETDVCDLYITPAIENAGWDPMKQIRREVTLAPGPVVVRGNMSSRNKKKFADYVLAWEPGVPVAVVEAKDNNHTVSHGIQQALGYAEILEIPSAFSSNGDAFASHNKVPVPGEDIETEFPLQSFPPPKELWKRYKQYRGIADDAEKLVVQPYHDDLTGKEPRYYQVDAINRTIEAVAAGKAELDNFIDPESKFPVIATTSELLTTGVDAKTCKLIVLDKTIPLLRYGRINPRHARRRIGCS
jgi:type I restriction enzyme R subunit